MPEPITLAVAGGLANTVNAAVTVARFAYEIKNTPKDVKTCLDMVCRVDEDIQFAINLRAQNLKQLSVNPETLRRLDRIIKQASESIIDVGRLLEGCRKEAHGGKVPFQGRVKWILGDSVAFSRRTANLQQQHAAVNVEIAYMRQMEALKPLKDLASSTTFENAELLSMSRKRSSSRLSVFSDFGMDAPPPEYSKITPRQSMVFDSTSFYQHPPHSHPNPEKREPSPDSVTPRQSMAFHVNTWLQPATEPAQDCNELEADSRPTAPKEWEPDIGHVAQNWNPEGSTPRALVPGSWESSDVKSRQSWDSFEPPSTTMSRKWEPPVPIPPKIKFEPESFPQTATSRGWQTGYPSPPLNDTPSVISIQTSISRGWETSYPNPAQNHTLSSISPHSTASRGWELPATSQPQGFHEVPPPPKSSEHQRFDYGFPNSQPNHKSAAVFPQSSDTRGWENYAPNQTKPLAEARGTWSSVSSELESVTPDLLRSRSSSTVSSQFTTARGWQAPGVNTPQSYDTPVSPPSITSRVWDTNHSTYNAHRRDEPEEDEDPEAAFYRDLRLQEEEKQRKRAARMNSGAYHNVHR